MTHNYQTYILTEETSEPISGSVKWSSPSNIALVKYWGKVAGELQIPANPSISMTLKHSCSTFEVAYEPRQIGRDRIRFRFHGEEAPAFVQKIEKFFGNIEAYFPFLANLSFDIRSENTFPHSAGIASSAASMSALALCLCSIEQKHFNSLQTDAEFYNKASFIARIGSGSASRSVYGGYAIWGNSRLEVRDSKETRRERLEVRDSKETRDSIRQLPDETRRNLGVWESGSLRSSDLYAVGVNEHIHPVFKGYRDAILIVNSKEKAVSSTQGHQLMNDHIYKAARIEQANINLNLILEALKTGDTDTFVDIVESEALSLHAMMLTSNPGFMLFKPDSLAIIEKIRYFRKQYGISICFTLDAGPNIHLLYPADKREQIRDFINQELKIHCEDGKWLDDEYGEGPIQMKNSNED